MRSGKLLKFRTYWSSATCELQRGHGEEQAPMRSAGNLTTSDTTAPASPYKPTTRSMSLSSARPRHPGHHRARRRPRMGELTEADVAFPCGRAAARAAARSPGGSRRPGRRTQRPARPRRRRRASTTRPPTRSRASTTTTSAPSRRSASAAARPARPAPITTILNLAPVRGVCSNAVNLREMPRPFLGGLLSGGRAG